MEKQSDRIIALLGPTNTGKTYVAIEKMLEHETGIFGLPLRLLAREVYDKCVDKVGIEKVALITGEEKIIPSTANYFIRLVFHFFVPANLFYTICRSMLRTK